MFYLGNNIIKLSFLCILDHHRKNHKPGQSHQKHGLDSKERTFLMKELALLNSTEPKKIFLNSRHKNSSKDFVMFVSTSNSAVEVNKAPHELSDFTEGGVSATSGLHYQDQYTKRYEWSLQLVNPGYCLRWGTVHGAE